MTEHLSDLPDDDLEAELARRRAQAATVPVGEEANVSRKGVAMVCALIAGVVVFVAWQAHVFGGGPPADHSASIAASIGANSCTQTSYEITDRIDGSKEVIYDCQMTNGSEKCVTEQNHLVQDSTAVVKILFANTLSGGRPSCAS